MTLIIRNLANAADKKYIKVTGVEINPLDNVIFYIEVGKKDQVQTIKMQTTHNYFITHK